MIKQAKEKKILGIIVDEKLTFKSHIEYICTKASKSYDLVAILMLSPANYVTIYNSFIRSHLEYCCPTWSHPGVIFRAGMNEPPIKLARAVSSNCISYHEEIDAILLALKYILSTQSQVSANTIHIFSDSMAVINAITSLSPQEIHGNIEEITHISNSLKCFSVNVTYSQAHCGVTQNEEAARLAKAGA